MQQNENLMNSKKELYIQNLFNGLNSQEAIYQKILSLAKQESPFDPQFKSEEYRVKGCQSNMFLYSIKKDGKLKFYVSSDALISQGLALIVTYLFNHETPNNILQYQPNILTNLKITTSLSMNRSNGVQSLMTTIKKHALNHITNGEIQ